MVVVVVVVDASFTGDFFWGTWRVVERFLVGGPSSSQAKNNRELSSRLAAFCSAAQRHRALKNFPGSPKLGLSVFVWGTSRARVIPAPIAVDSPNTLGKSRWCSRYPVQGKAKARAAETDISRLPFFQVPTNKAP